MINVAVIGDGGWGTAIALLLHSKGIKPVLWSYSPEYAEYLRKNRENVKFLKGIKIPSGLNITSSIETVKDADYAVFAVPCEYLSFVSGSFKGANFKYVISATKGIENTSLRRPSEILTEHFSAARVGVLSGPSIAYEVANRFPATVVFASGGGWENDIQGVLTTAEFRVYTSDDVIGVELGGALKNVIAIAAGISDGLGFGANSKAAILTRGLAEITRIGVRMGARRETFSGLSGIGDLATTCMSSHSRNRWFGEQMGKGRKIKDILSETEMVVEGMATCKSAYALSKKHGVEMPIARKIYEIVYEDKDPRIAVKELMARDLKREDYE